MIFNATPPGYPTLRDEGDRVDPIEEVAKDFFFDPTQPVHPSMQNDAWDEWKSNRDIA